MANTTHILSGAIKGISEASATHGANIVQARVDGSKATRVSFSTVVSGNATSGSGATVSGARLAKSVLNEAQGDIYTNGDMPGTFFAVSDGSGRVPVRSMNDDNAPLVFTRNCDFIKQKDDTYRNSAGQYLCGINYDSNGNLPAGGINLQNLKIMRTPSITTTATPTSKIELSMKLPANAPTNQTETFEAAIVDSLGVTHNATYTLTKNATQNQWNLTGIALTSGGAVSSPLNIPILFDNTGSISQIGGVAGATGSPASLNVTFDFSGNGAAAGQVVNLDLGVYGIGSKITQNGPEGKASIVYYSRSDGAQPSEAISSEISADGVLFTSFTGSTALKPRGQIVLAVFGNVNELGNANGTTQVMKVEAGNFTLAIPNSGNGGSLVPSHLEKSTTDSTQEYVFLLDNVNHQAILVAGLKHAMEADRSLTTL